MIFAGRLAKENNKVYLYSGLDKVANILEDNKVIASYNYSISGQLASATTDGATENFLWDGLALIRRGDTDYTNEPYVTGGNPVVAGDKVLFNDILGNTVGIKSEDKLKIIQMTAFGETADKDAFFTGKPAVNNLGYSFLFRNYRADQGKWLSSDPMGYPDGWNNLAYGNNSFVMGVDVQGTEWVWELTSDVDTRGNYHNYETRTENNNPAYGSPSGTLITSVVNVTYHFVSYDAYYYENDSRRIRIMYYWVDQTTTTYDYCEPLVG